MLVCKIKKWGNSIGILIPKEEALDLHLKENQEVVVEIAKKENPFKELFGFGQKMGKKIANKEFLEAREFFESKWV